LFWLRRIALPSPRELLLCSGARSCCTSNACRATAHCVPTSRGSYKMKTKIVSTIAVVAMIWGGGAVRYSPAQTRSETPVEHARSGHQMNGPSDGAFHRRFEDAEKWAKESIIRNATPGRSLRRFWTPCICSALRLSPISARGPGISACGLQSASRNEAILPNLREPAVASSCRSTPGSYRCRGYMCIPTTLNHTRAP